MSAGATPNRCTQSDGARLLDVGAKVNEIYAKMESLQEQLNHQTWALKWIETELRIIRKAQRLANGKVGSEH